MNQKQLGIRKMLRTDNILNSNHKNEIDKLQNIYLFSARKSKVRLTDVDLRKIKPDNIVSLLTTYIWN